MKTRFKDFLLLEGKRYNIQRPANVPEEYWYDPNQDLNRKEEYLDGKDGRANQYWRDADKKLHRDDDKPAEIWNDGGMVWYKHGKEHRVDGPAIIYPNGRQYWCMNSICHRLDGPAVVASNGDQHWYVNWINITNKVESTPAFWPADKRIVSVIWKQVKDGTDVKNFYNCIVTGKLLFPEVKELLEKYPQSYFELTPDDDGEINLDDNQTWCDQASNDCFDL